MTSHTTDTAFDLENLTYTRITAQNVRRSAELARADYVADSLKRTGARIAAVYRSAGELFSFAQRQNQAARL